jgi:conjugal transfer pilus assembly protein TraL
MRSIQIPRHIDSMPQFFFWEIDEFVIIAATFGVGIFIGGLYTLPALPLGFFFASRFARYKSNGLPGQLNHLAHWFNIMNVNKAFIRSGERRIFR